MQISCPMLKYSSSDLLCPMFMMLCLSPFCQVSSIARMENRENLVRNKEKVIEKVAKNWGKVMEKRFENFGGSIVGVVSANLASVMGAFCDFLWTAFGMDGYRGQYDEAV